MSGNEVVVGARIQALDPVGHRVAGGQHQDRNTVAGAAQAPAYLHPVDIGHAQVEHDCVRRRLADQLEALPAPPAQLTS